MRKAGCANAMTPGHPRDLEVSPGAALFGWTAAVLQARAPVNAEAKETLLELLAERLVEHGDKLYEILLTGTSGTQVPAARLTVLDGTLVGMSGMDHFIDLRTGAAVGTPKQPPIEAVSYDLTALFLLHLQRVGEEEDRERRRSHAEQADEDVGLETARGS